MQRYVLICACVLAFAAQFASAQPDPNHPEAGPAQKQQNVIRQWMVKAALLEHTMVAQNARGVFILRNGMLAKFNPDSLAQEGLVDLFPPDAENTKAPPANPFRGGKPAIGDDADTKALLVQALRLLPSTLLLRDHDILVVAGESYFRIDTATLAIKATSRLVPVVDDKLADVQKLAKTLERLQASLSPVTLASNDTTLFIVRGIQIAAVDIEQGTVTAMTQLPLRMRSVVDNVKNVRPAGKRDTPPPKIQPEDMTVVGVLIHHTDKGLDCWTVKNVLGNEFVLDGPKVKELLAIDGVTAGRVRLSGKALMRLADDPQYGAGTLTVLEYQILPKVE